MLLRTAFLLFAIVGAVAPALAQTPGPSPRQLFDQACQTCHGNPQVPRAADPAVLRQMSPERIYGVLTTGVMQPQASSLERSGQAQHRRVPGRPQAGRGRAGSRRAHAQSLRAVVAHARRGVARDWNGWGADLAEHTLPAGAGQRPASGAGAAARPALGLRAARRDRGLRPADSRGRARLRGRRHGLRLRARSADRLRALGVPGPGRCPQRRHDRRRSPPAAAGRSSAISAATSTPWTPPPARWSGPSRADDHALARITASPVLYRDRLYVSVASNEEGASTSPRYPCCTFRGSVLALQAATGAVAWKTYTITEPPAPTRLSPAGIQMHGPSGAGRVERADDRPGSQRALRRHRQQLLAARRRRPPMR